MSHLRKTCVEILMCYPVVKAKWTQVPDPEVVFGEVDKKLEYLKDLYSAARTSFDKYISSLIYEALEREKDTKKKITNQPKYARLNDEIRKEKLFEDLPFVKDVLPSHIGKDFRPDDYPTVEECALIRHENADYHQVPRFGRITRTGF